MSDNGAINNFELSISLADDCEIDDPEIFTSKKHLAEKTSPLNVIKALEGKHKNLSFKEEVQEHKDHAKGCNIFTVTWSLKGYGIEGKAIDSNK